VKGKGAEAGPQPGVPEALACRISSIKPPLIFVTCPILLTKPKSRSPGIQFELEFRIPSSTLSVQQFQGHSVFV
jgi:hypothetical protein